MRVVSLNMRDRAERALVSLLHRPDREEDRPAAVGLTLWMLRQLSHLYRLAMRARLFLYDHGVIRHHALGCQVISVGNLTVGGTGKTPVVEILARELQRAGRKVAILSRGYKKARLPLGRRILDLVLFREYGRPPRVVSDGKKLLLDSAMSGDEPYMLASNLPEVAVLVDKDRVKSGRYAINKLGCDTLVLDDGFQYLSLKHRADIVLVDRTNPFGNGHVLPRGILRESTRNIRRANFVFITKSDGTGTEALRERLRTLNPRAEIVECRHSPRFLKNVFTAEVKELDWLKGLRVAVVSGIAAPAGFEAELRRLGADVVQTFRFADHHRYEQQELIDLVNRSRKKDAAAIVTTEKDAVRFPRLVRRDVPFYFLRVDIEIVSGFEDFQACIARICFR
jgi:tetraacyldisaccharide 4'-kinase